VSAALWFVASGGAVVAAGVVLARVADAIANVTGLGRLWIGSVLLAAATSLPEAMTDVAAVRLGAVDLAVGDLLGSSMANMLILAAIDLLPPRRHVLRQATLDHALAACLAITLNALGALLVFARPTAAVLGVSPGSLLLLVVYLAGTRAVYRHVRRPGGASGAAARTSRATALARPLLGFAVATVIVAVAAPAFARAAKALADETGLGTTFVGTWLVGLSTSLPELVASVAAVRMGAFDLAVGNLFGSNGFNMALFVVLDLVHPGPSVFAVLDPSHVISALIAVVLTSLGLAAIVYRAERRFALIEPDSLLMVVTYLLGVWLLYAYAVPD
jgi:cation:H+ antiporter